MSDKKVKVFKLRTKSETELAKELDQQKNELSTLRIAKVAGGTAAKLGKIKVVRKNIAKYLTVISQKNREAIATQYKGKKGKPMDIRAKKTRAIRRKLTSKQANSKTLRQLKREKNFPLRKFAVKA